jgi:hypothetical protein
VVCNELRLREPVNYLRANWIRPEDLHLYENLGYENFKIVERNTPTLILLDELPPYLDNAKSIAIGNSDLSRVTATALTNLFEAVAEKELGQVCVVITDLVGTYAEASAQIQTVLQQLQQEAQRHAMNLTPVQINTDEFYHILRKRLFTSLPKESEIDEVAQAYAKAVREARQMDITAQSPEQFAQLVKSSYPFHPAIRDLYARFRENQGFQQTRALIRIMRIIASRLWNSGEAKTRFLISVHDIDLNDAEALSEVRRALAAGGPAGVQRAIRSRRAVGLRRSPLCVAGRACRPAEMVRPREAHTLRRSVGRIRGQGRPRALDVCRGGAQGGAFRASG